jgi:squalene-associated FAD-dependent desaturase
MTAPPTTDRPHVAVVGGGLAGLTAALECADGGARVTLLERRQRLGGLTWSFESDGRSVDNGQHVFLRCCDAYRAFLERVGSAGDVAIQDRLDVPVVRPGAGGPQRRRITRTGLPAPAHLAASLAGYRFLTLRERARLAQAVLPLRRLDLDDPRLDDVTFGAWLAGHGQTTHAVEVLWDLITVATVNLPAAEASLAMGAKVFQTGLLTDPAAADIGWATAPLGTLHGQRAGDALRAAGAEILLGERVVAVEPTGGGRWAVRTSGRAVEADGVVVALPHLDVAGVVPPATFPAQDRVAGLGASPIVDVHLVYNSKVTDDALLAGVDTPLQWLFDRTGSSGLTGGGQYLAISLSAAGEAMGRHPQEVAADAAGELPRLLPRAGRATLRSSLVTKERTATFAAVPGSGALRPAPKTDKPGLWLAGAWTDTGWPATMEGACRSGRAAGRGALADAARRCALVKEVA